MEKVEVLLLIRISLHKGNCSVSPTLENIKGGAHSLLRPLYSYTNGGPSSLTKEFTDFALSEKGQEHCESSRIYLTERVKN